MGGVYILCTLCHVIEAVSVCMCVCVLEREGSVCCCRTDLKDFRRADRKMWLLGLQSKCLAVDKYKVMHTRAYLCSWDMGERASV